MAAAAIAVSAVAGCGGQNRGALAEKTVRSYWGDISQGRLKQAYAIISPGQQQANPLTQWGQNIFDFLHTTGGIRVTVGKAIVDGDNASVPVRVKFNEAPDPRNDKSGYQHLFWLNGTWRIADESGELSHSKQP
jgi:hypothetical protein